MWNKFEPSTRDAMFKKIDLCVNDHPAWNIPNFSWNVDEKQF